MPLSGDSGAIRRDSRMGACMRIITAILVSALSLPAYAWDGYDYGSGDHVVIESGNLVRPGETIEFYDYGSGQYRSADVESISRYGSSVEVEVYDHDSGEYRTLDMEDN